MSIELAEQLKRDLTDKYVVVDRSVPELKRFAPLTGIVKTVNMNCRALVQFLGTEDISWYDIDPAYLTVVDKPVETRPEPAHAPAAKRPAGKSSLELARQQGAAGAGKGEGEGAAKPLGRKLSPLELARQQGAAKSGEQTAKEPTGAADSAKTPAEGKKLSPLERARQQGAAKRADSGSPAKDRNVEDSLRESKRDSRSESPTTAESAPAKSTEPKAGGRKLSPLELARQQGGYKGEKSASGPAASEPDSARAAESEESQTAVATAEREPETGNGQAEPAPEKKQAPTTGPDGRPLSKVELARLQGPAKR